MAFKYFPLQIRKPSLFFYKLADKKFPVQSGYLLMINPLRFHTLRQMILQISPGQSLARKACHKDGWQPAQGFLPANLIKLALINAVDLNARTVTLTGASPFAHPDFTRLAAWITRVAPPAQCFTLEVEAALDDLTTASIACLADLAQAGFPCRVMIGVEQRAPGSRRPVASPPSIAAARLLAAAGVETQVVYHVYQSRFKQVDEMIHLGEDLGAAKIIFLPRPFARSSAGSTGLTVAEWSALGRRLERECAPYTRLSVLIDQPPAFLGLSPQFVIQPANQCSPIQSLTVLSSGEISMCGSTAHLPELILGRLGVDDLKCVWESHPLLEHLRQTLPHGLEGVCGQCSLKSVCMGYCPAETYARTGSFTQPYWFCDAAHKSGLFPAGRISA